jgi:hypothetical protein
LEAVASLYDDGLKPFGRILRKRLLELCPGVSSMDVAQLRRHCESHACLEVQNESGGEWSALCRGRAEDFVDVYSPNDVYDASLWQALALYFGSWSPDAAPLSGGRYACGLDLKERRLPFLQGFSLGQICHIVQLAISQKKILGYQGSDVVPYARSQCFRKEQNIEQARATARPQSTLSWDLVRACLRDLLEVEGTTVLANLKRIFQARFQFELSEISLGYAKISEVLRDERLRDICHLRLESGGYVVVAGSESVSSLTESEEEAEEEDYDAVVSVFHTSHLQDSIRSIECPWGPTPEGSFIMPSERMVAGAQPGALDAASLSLRQHHDDEDEDYDAAVEMFHRNPAHDSIRSMECPWGPTPEHSFNLAELQTGADLVEALRGMRLVSLAEHGAKSEGSTFEGESTEEC